MVRLCALALLGALAGAAPPAGACAAAADGGCRASGDGGNVLLQVGGASARKVWLGAQEGVDPAKTFYPLGASGAAACRGDSPSDNSPEYYFLEQGTLEECKAMCAAAPACTGIEHKEATGRCEIWTRKDGARATAKVVGFSCLVYSDAAFEPVGDGTGAACRGSSSADNDPSYYAARFAPSLEACKGLCAADPSCTAIEHSGRRCEIWTRAGGAGATKALAGFACLNRKAVSTTTATTTSTTTTMETTTEEVQTTTTTGSGRSVCTPPPNGSREKCQNCFHSIHCKEGMFCCPYMKKCVPSSSTPCYYPIANCRPLCYNSACNPQTGCSCNSCAKVGAGKEWGWLQWTSLDANRQATCEEP